jgi:hypothetical protein|tara:strand:- start:431 stop:628 length:198 start_codon:yes stop_codon:yes gene_type:complete
MLNLSGSLDNDAPLTPFETVEVTCEGIVSALVLAASLLDPKATPEQREAALIISCAFTGIQKIEA